MQQYIFINWSIESTKTKQSKHVECNHNYQMTLNVSSKRRINVTLSSLERWLISNKRRINSWSFDKELSFAGIEQHNAIESLIIKTLNK